ncbi:MAG: hypothetical protein L3J53_03395 [Proteobacteria bacterium]|nr:hypothetical protein [Pseudomonadota bacterium]
MRIAAGVILIIAAVFNLVASLGYVAGGVATTGLSEVAIYAEQQSGNQMTAEQQTAIDVVQDKVAGTGIGLMAFGVFLLVSVGILIAGAVFLFQNKKPQFIMIAGGMAIAAEVIGILITTFGIMNILGLVGGILAILAAKSMGSGSAPEPLE